MCSKVEMFDKTYHFIVIVVHIWLSGKFCSIIIILDCYLSFVSISYLYTYLQVGVFFGGLAIAKDEQVLKSNCPNIVVGTPGRILALVRSKKLQLKNLKHFILDECDKMLEQLGKSYLSIIHEQ